MDSHQHTNLFTGQATLEATISRRRHGCAIRGMCIVSANAWDAMWGTLGVYATARGRLLQVASDEIRWLAGQASGCPNFINGANSALLFPGATGNVSHTIPCECAKSVSARHPPLIHRSREHAGSW